MRRSLHSQNRNPFRSKTVSNAPKPPPPPNTTIVTSIVGRRRWTRMLAGLVPKMLANDTTTTVGAVHSVCVCLCACVCQLHSDIWTSFTQTQRDRFAQNESPILVVVVVTGKLTASSGFDTHIQRKRAILRGGWRVDRRDAVGKVPFPDRLRAVVCVCCNSSES